VSVSQNAVMHKRPIPSSGEMLPVVGLGTWQSFDIGDDPAAFEQRKQVLQILFEAGGIVVDSSPMYGRSEDAAGRALAVLDARARAFVATKVWTSGEREGIAQMQQSAKLMRAPVIDLMQIHNLVDWRTHIKTLRAWKEQGQFRYIGITHYTNAALDDLAAVLRAEPLDFVQFAYSIDVREAEKTLLPLAYDKGVATLINKPFGTGGLFRAAKGRALPPVAAETGAASWAQFFLKFILGHRAVTCVIPATGNPVHARDNFAAGQGLIPDEAQRARMLAAWQAA